MSTFACPIVRVDKIIEHGNADLLEIALIGGYRCVVQKGIHKEGDLVCYIPTDSLLPENVIEALGLTGKLSGKQKNRVRAVKLRGEYSEGVVMPIALMKSVAMGGRADWVADVLLEGCDCAAWLGITKYEEELPVQMRGVARPRPDWFPKYTDIENWKKYPRIFAPDEWVLITEKIHGTNAGYGMHRDDLDTMYVSSRNFVLEYDETNLYWMAGLEYDLPDILAALLERTESESIVIWAEIFGTGVQDLSYGPGKKLRWFDLMLDGKYVDLDVARNLIGDLLPMVPLVDYGPFELIDLATLANEEEDVSGDALHMREGVVIRPLTERTERGLGRVILKYIGHRYELRKGGTEFK